MLQMAERQKKSFSQVALVEAVARQTGVCLVIRPIHPHGESRLCSRLLGINEDTDLVLAAPWTRAGKDKVFIPVGWGAEVTFPVAEFVLQVPTRVLGHCQFPLRPPRRVDAMVLRSLGKVVPLYRRRQPRHDVSPSTVVVASVWPAAQLSAGARPRSGVLANRSGIGLGIRFEKRPLLETDRQMIVRLEDSGADSRRIYRATLKHCTPLPDGKWLAGFGDLVELTPGRAVPIMEALALPVNTPGGETAP